MGQSMQKPSTTNLRQLLLNKSTAPSKQLCALFIHMYNCICILLPTNIPSQVIFILSYRRCYRHIKNKWEFKKRDNDVFNIIQYLFDVRKRMYFSKTIYQAINIEQCGSHNKSVWYNSFVFIVTISAACWYCI